MEHPIHYLIYKTTNLVNGKEYIGKHQTNVIEDGYLGSGKYLKRAIKKHGIESFKREVLFLYESEEEMNSKEAELVTEEYCSQDNTYNICPGGRGGFGYINTNSLGGFAGRKHTENVISKKRHLLMQESHPIHSIESRCKRNESNKGHTRWLGKKHSVQTLEKMKLSVQGRQQGQLNSQYGTCWITDGSKNKKIQKYDLDTWIEKGYKKGRISQSPKER